MNVKIPKPISVKSFTSKYNGISKVLINKIQVSNPFDNKNKGFDINNTIKYNGLWDTGATNTVINRNVVDDLKLSATSATEVRTAAGITKANVYIINLWLPNGIIIPDLQVTEGDLGDTDLLIGMDVMNRGDFSVSNFNGITCFSFRVPSLEAIDYTTNLHKNKQVINSNKKVGVNESCPCGSGKKYKNCCGN